MTAKKTTAKKTTAKKTTAPVDDQADEVEATEPAPPADSHDPLVLASMLDTFTVTELAERTGVPAREIRLALQPVIDDGQLRRRPDGAWEWS